jgi:hypothetical protein
LNDDKKVKYLALALIEMEILLCRGSAQKIETESGTTADGISKISAPNTNNRPQG